MQVIKAHPIKTAQNPGDLIIAQSYGKFYVAYETPRGSIYRRTREFNAVEEAQEAFDHVVSTENWNGVLPAYA